MGVFLLEVTLEVAGTLVPRALNPRATEAGVGEWEGRTELTEDTDSFNF